MSHALLESPFRGRLTECNHSVQSVILASRPPITLPTLSVPPSLLDELISELGALSAVYHKYAHRPSYLTSRTDAILYRQARPGVHRWWQARCRPDLDHSAQRSSHTRGCARDRRGRTEGRECMSYLVPSPCHRMLMHSLPCQLLDFDDDEPEQDASADLFSAPAPSNASANPLDGA